MAKFVDMRTIAIIEARMTSTRLPGKVLLPILGRPMLELMIERVRRAQRIDQVMLATTVNASDDAIVELAQRTGVGWYRGSEEDVLERVLFAAQSVNADLIVELTGDCPLIEPRVIDKLIEVYAGNNFDYVANILKRTYPRGLDTQVFSTATLARVAGLTKDPHDREHVSLYIYQHPEHFYLHNVESELPQRYWNLRWTVDVHHDFQLVEKIYAALYPNKPNFTMYDILELMDAKPELAELNRSIEQKRERD